MPSAQLLLPRLLGDLSVASFLACHYLAAPLLRRGTCHPEQALASWEVVERLVERTECELVLVRDGAALCPPRRTAAELRRLHADDTIVALRHVERHDPGLAALGRALSDELHGAASLELHATPAGRGGFGWRHDAEEVFVLQVEGTTRVALRESSAPCGDRGRPAMVEEVCLEAGDLLYVPGGHWYDATAGEDSLVIAVGLLPPTALDVLGWLREELADDPAWRRPLPPLGRAAPVDDAARLAAMRALCRGLSQALAGELDEPELALRLLEASRRGRRPEA